MRIIPGAPMNKKFEYNAFTISFSMLKLACYFFGSEEVNTWMPNVFQINTIISRDHKKFKEEYDKFIESQKT